mmetsp:Transcript_10744/g.25118  ORF Transcript_10744/g.25118 Transcript_10744/m.25118 type:complete len:207 (+) Transcript_10744:1559-2179(+)
MPMAYMRFSRLRRSSLNLPTKPFSPACSRLKRRRLRCMRPRKALTFFLCLLNWKRKRDSFLSHLDTFLNNLEYLGAMPATRLLSSRARFTAASALAYAERKCRASCLTCLYAAPDDLAALASRAARAAAAATSAASLRSRSRFTAASLARPSAVFIIAFSASLRFSCSTRMSFMCCVLGHCAFFVPTKSFLPALHLQSANMTFMPL